MNINKYTLPIYETTECYECYNVDCLETVKKESEKSMNENNIVKAVATKKCAIPIKTPTKAITAERKTILPYDLQLEYERILNMKIELEKLALEIKTAETSYNHLLQRYIKEQAKLKY